jgi:hypothetical protein
MNLTRWCMPDELVEEFEPQRPPRCVARGSAMSVTASREMRYRVPRDALTKLGMSVTLFRCDVFCGIVLHCDTFEEEPPPQP